MKDDTPATLKGAEGEFSQEFFEAVNTYGGARCASDEIHACVAVPAKFADDYWSSSTNGRLDLI